MTFGVDSPLSSSTRHELLDRALLAYTHLFGRTSTLSDRQRMVRRTFERGLDALLTARLKRDGIVATETEELVTELLDASSHHEDADTALTWLDLLPRRVVEYLQPPSYSLVLEAIEVQLQTAAARFAEWPTKPVRPAQGVWRTEEPERTSRSADWEEARSTEDPTPVAA